MEGVQSKTGLDYRVQYAPYRVTSKTTTKTAEEIFQMLKNAGVRINEY